MRRSTRQYSIQFRAAAIGFVAALATGCDRDTPQPDSADAVHVQPAVQRVGSVGGMAITLGEIERAVSLQLYDIEMQRYRLLRGATEARLLAQLDADGDAGGRAEIGLIPPEAPRTGIPVNVERARPAGDYPIEIVAFCNLESAHCKKLHGQLGRILPLFEGVAQYSERDLILPFHRYAQQAAEAAYCAQDQGRYWQYRDVLLAEQGAPDYPRILKAGRAAGLSMDRFEDCVRGGLHKAGLRQDAALAEDLGLAAVPAVFVNGLYAGAAPESGHLIWLIERELDRLGVDSPRMQQVVQRSRAPVQVNALIHASEPGQGLVVLSPQDAVQSAKFYREGDPLGAGLTVRRVKPNRVEIDNRGTPEWIDFTAPAADAVGSSTADLEAVDEKARAALEYPHRGVPVFLDRTEVLVRMTDVAALESSLETVPMTAGGYHLLRISTVESGSLFELLGLEQGDVLVMVNEQPMHEGEKPLWNALQSEDEVRVRVMRKGGLAHHYTYRFAD